MEIIKQSRPNIDREVKYRLVSDPTIGKMSDNAGKQIPVVDWILYETVQLSTGELQKVLAILSENDQAYATNSPTFIESFERIVECFENDFDKINVIEQKSNKGRNFLICTWAK